MNRDPSQQTPEERRKVIRAIIILYGAMFLLTAILFTVLWWVQQAKHP